ncbi:MAG TPA: ABC transporter permease [Acidobacteriota bacterium]|nr:ABC transporter permease [Acidobacteriota bacterium]
MSTLLQDVRFALRTLRRGWLITGLAIVSLALAIAGNGIVFSLTNGLLFRPLPFDDPGNLMLLWLDREGQVPPANFTPLSEPELIDYRERTRGLGLLEGFRGARVNWTRGDRPEPLMGERVTDGMFQVLGVDALHGRTFEPGEEHEKVVVLQYRFWEERLGADVSILGQTLQLNSEPYTVLGVMPPEFEIFTPGAKLWIPLPLEKGQGSRSNRNLLVLGRLAPGVGLPQARAEIETVSRRLREEHPETTSGHSAVLERFQDRIPDDQNRILMALLQFALIFVLAIACANIANLLLARGYERQREFAVRRALGAGRLRILRQLLSESLFLSLAGGAIGMLLAYVGIHFMHAAFAPLMPAFMRPVLDTNVVLYTLAVTVAGGLFFGSAPALQGSRVEISDTLREGGRGATAGGRRRLLSKGLVVAEVSMAAVLLAGAVMLIQSFSSLQRVESGFDTSNLLTMGVSLPGERYKDEQSASFFEQAAERLAGLPDVEGATAASSLPRMPFLPSVPFTPEDLVPRDGESPPSALCITVLPGYFETLGIPLRSGRPLLDSDRGEGQAVAVISRSLAQRWFAEEEAVGGRLRVLEKERRIVGVVDDVMQIFLQVGSQGQAVIYLPLAQQSRNSMAFMLKTRGEAAPGLSQSIRQEMESLERDATVGQMLTLDAFIAQFFTGARVISIIMGGFGALALVLSAVGIYGVLAYSVVQRRHEIGVRMALGAGKGQVLGLITRQGLMLTAIGLLLALPGVLAAHYGISYVLAGIAEVEGSGLGAVALVLVLVAGAACYLPARRAAAVDPIQALRSE